jgi:hypothetical protein
MFVLSCLLIILNILEALLHLLLEKRELSKILFLPLVENSFSLVHLVLQVEKLRLLIVFDVHLHGV